MEDYGYILILTKIYLRKFTFYKQIFFLFQLTLERHVNGHFNGDGTQHNSAKKSVENSSAKLFKRNGKKIRFRRQPWSGNTKLYNNYHWI